MFAGVLQIKPILFENTSTINVIVNENKFNKIRLLLYIFKSYLAKY